MRFPQLLTAALAIVALPAPAMAAGPVAAPVVTTAAKAAKKPAKPAKPANTKPAQPAKPMEMECCKPDAAVAAKPADKAADCCAEGRKPGAKGAAADCCAEGMKAGAKPGAECCAAGAKAKADALAAKPKMECCDDPKADGSCCSPDKPHGMPGGERREVRIEKRFERRWGGERGGRMGHGPMMMRGDRFKGPEARYMLGNPGGAQHLILGRSGAWQATPWLSVGHQMNWALQLNNTNALAGPWVTPYGGFVPRLGAQLGPIRGDLGALLGAGGMFRTGQVSGGAGPVNDVLQARLMWVVEPRVELGWRGERHGVSLVGAYTLTPNMNDFGGPSVGLKLTWKREGWR